MSDVSVPSTSPRSSEKIARIANHDQSVAALHPNDDGSFIAVAKWFRTNEFEYVLFFFMNLCDVSSSSSITFTRN
jgi:hypothetical protein